MIHPDEFDAFYQRTRNRLLLQTYALTGDLPAARSAVRDSFILTWHHWRKVSRLPDPESWVRPHAWAQAGRRHTARIWYRDKGLQASAKATLDALGKLSWTQRQAVVLGQTTSLDGAETARELGIPRAEADRVVRVAGERFCAQREVPAESVGPLFEELAGLVAETRWPRVTIIRRAGAARRRTHTVVGAAAAVLAVFVTGALVGSSTEPAASGADRDRREQVAPATDDTNPVTEFSADRLLTAAELSRFVDGRRWTERRTTDNSEGNGRVTPCQQQRYADPNGISAVVRRYGTTPRSGGPHVAAVESAELSGSTRAARRAWQRLVSWYGGCASSRVQLIGNHAVNGVGDQAMLFHLHRPPASTYLVGVARTGKIVTTTFTSTTASRRPDLDRAGRLLAGAVDRLCTTESAGACATGASVHQVRPVAVGEVPGLLAEADLPPIAGVQRPWVGTAPLRARDNVAATRCDRTDFGKRPVSHAVTRTFLIPQAKLPAAFGVTETVGTLPEERAREFVRTIRDRMASCEDRDPGSEVSQLTSVATEHHDLSIWRVSMELTDHQTVTYLMGIARDGTAVGQVGFVSAKGLTMPPGAFDALVRRASARLQYLPGPKR